MFKNYIQIALKVLKRRKFFTFISLFGITFTLTVLIILSSFIDHLLSPKYPEVNRDKSVYMFGMKMEGKKGSYQTPSSAYFLKEYFSDAESFDKMAIASFENLEVNAFAGSQKIKLQLKYTDAGFWDVLNFNFIEGKAFGEQDMESGERLAIITQEAKRKYFGGGSGSVVGKFVELGRNKYRIKGVVEGVPMTRVYSSADIYIPYSNSQIDLKSKSFRGNFAAIFMGDKPGDIPKIKKEVEAIGSKIALPNPKEFNKLQLYPDSYLESLIRSALGGTNTSYTTYFFILISILSVLFMLLPALNLVTLNINRIIERSSEIGIRKAFGASSGSLLVQFLVENLIITLIGGVLAVALAGLLITTLNSSGVIPYLDLAINLKVIAVSLMVVLFFGFISGVLPAFRMSKMQAVDALRDGSKK